MSKRWGAAHGARCGAYIQFRVRSAALAGQPTRNILHIRFRIRESLRVFQNGRTARLGNERRAASARVQVVVGQMMETGVHYGSACAVAVEYHRYIKRTTCHGALPGSGNARTTRFPFRHRDRSLMRMGGQEVDAA